MAQQTALADLNGYVEEMVNGQKVVKVFCHEQRSIEEFDKINDALFEDSYRAHAYASVLGPIIGNIGNFLCVALGLLGGVLLLICALAALPDAIYWLPEALTEGGSYWTWLVEDSMPMLMSLTGGIGCLFGGWHIRTSRRMRRKIDNIVGAKDSSCLLYTSPSPRDS